MDISILFSKDYLPILISVLALTVSLWSAYLNKKKYAIDIYNRESDISLGISKLSEALFNVQNLKNIDPNNLTVGNFNQDKACIEKLIEEYKISETQIVKSNYSLPSIILSLKGTMSKLEKNFSGSSEHSFHSVEAEQIINYQSIFFNLAMLYSVVVNSSHRAYLEENKLHTEMLLLYEKFDKKYREIMQISFNKTIQLMDDFSSKYFLENK